MAQFCVTKRPSERVSAFVRVDAAKRGKQGLANLSQTKIYRALSPATFGGKFETNSWRFNSPEMEKQAWKLARRLHNNEITKIPSLRLMRYTFYYSPKYLRQNRISVEIFERDVLSDLHDVYIYTEASNSQKWLFNNNKRRRRGRARLS